jgi:hypothetical protein
MKILYACMERENCIRNMYFEVVALLHIVPPARNNTAIGMTLLLRSSRGVFSKLRVQDLPTMTTSDT